MKPQVEEAAYIMTKTTHSFLHGYYVMEIMLTLVVDEALPA